MRFMTPSVVSGQSPRYFVTANHIPSSQPTFPPYPQNLPPVVAPQPIPKPSTSSMSLLSVHAGYRGLLAVFSSKCPSTLHQQPNQLGLVASHLNPSQAVRRCFPPRMISGNSNPGQPSQGQSPYFHPRPLSTSNPTAPVQTSNSTTPQDAKRAVSQEIQDPALPLHTNIKVVRQQQVAFAGRRPMVAGSVFLQKMDIAEQDIARK